MYIFDSLGIFDIALRGWKSAPLYYLLKALHYINKYGTAKQSEIEQLIIKAMNTGSLDLYGLHTAKLDVGYVTTGTPNSITYTYHYKGYPVYLNAVFLITLVRYYKLTGKTTLNGVDILKLADRLAGILLKSQWIYEHETPWGTLRLALYRVAGQQHMSPDP